MQEHSSRARIALYLVLFSGITWLGGLAVRAIIAFELFETGTLNYLNWFAPDFERAVFRMLAVSAPYTVFGYFVLLISTTLYLKWTPLKFKENGWLMMSAILFYMFVPVELYQMYYDARMILFERAIEGVINWYGVRQEPMSLLKARLAALSGVPVIALLCYYTIIGLCIWKPLTKTHREV